jgi:hypothetical protein
MAMPYIYRYARREAGPISRKENRYFLPIRFFFFSLPFSCHHGSMDDLAFPDTARDVRARGADFGKGAVKLQARKIGEKLVELTEKKRT